MNKVLAILQWEYLRRVRSKAFIITLVIPFLAIAISVVPQYLAVKSPGEQRTIAVMSNDTSMVSALIAISHENNGDKNISYLRLNKTDSADTSIRELILSGSFDAVIVPSDSFYQNAKISYYSSELGNDDIQRSRRFFNTLLQRERLHDLGISEDKLNYLRQTSAWSEFIINEKGDVDSTASELKYIPPFIFVFVLLIGLITSAQALISSVIEERSSRIVEILLTGVRPRELMAGKILGMGCVGLTQLVFYLLVMFLVSEPVLHLNIFASASLSIGKSIWYLLFFIAGYFLYSGIIITLGSLFDNERDAQQMSGFLTLFLIVPIYFTPYIIGNSDTLLTQILTWFPLFTPFLMIIRNGLFSVSPLLNSLVFLWLVGWLSITIFISARIFRTAILITGKRITLPEIIHWLKKGD